MLFSRLGMICSTLILLLFSLFTLVDGHLSKSIGIQYTMPYGTPHSCANLPPADYSYPLTAYICCNDDNSCHQNGGLLSFTFWPTDLTCDSKIHCLAEGFFTTGPFVYSCNHTTVPDPYQSCPSDECPAGSHLSQGNCVKCKKSQWSAANSDKCNDCPLRKHVVNGPGSSAKDCTVLRRQNMKQFYDDSGLFGLVLDKLSHSTRYQGYNDGQREDLKDAIVTWMIEVMYQETKIENMAQVTKGGGMGPGRGFFQYELATGGGSGTNKVAIQRAITWINNNGEAKNPDFGWLTKLQHRNAKTHKTDTDNLDFRQLSKEHQEIIFILDKYADKAPSYDELRSNLVKDTWDSVSYANWKRGHWKGSGTPPKWRGKDVWKKWVP